MLEKQQKKIRRHKRIRAKIIGTQRVPRFCVFRSNKHIYGQLIDDDKGKTILSVSDSEVKKSELKKPETRNPKSEKNSKSQIPEDKKQEIKRTGKVAIAYEIGKLIAEKALKNKIKKVVFDRGGYKYHGRVKAVAEGAREAGLVF